jgi:hypothetical protein
VQCVHDTDCPTDAGPRKCDKSQCVAP